MANINIKAIALLKNTWIQVLLLSLVVFLIYGNTLYNNFAYDDQDFIIAWTSIRHVENISDLLKGELPTSHQGVYRPVRSLFYVLSYKLWGSNPVGYHLQAILVQTIITLLVYLIVWQITLKQTAALIAGLLFAAHPVHTEAISFVTASFDTIGIGLFFASFYLYLKAEGRPIVYLSSFIYAVLAFFSYEMTLMLPFLIIAYDLAFRGQRIKEVLKKWRIYSIYFALVSLYPIIKILVLRVGDRATYLGEGFLKISKISRLDTPEIIYQYAKILISPVDLSVDRTPTYLFSNKMLDLFYFMDKGGRVVDYILPKIDFLIPVISTIIILYLTWKLFKKIPVILFGIWWFELSLIPVLNIISQGTVMAERFLYIPSFGFCLSLSFLLYKGLIFNLRKNAYNLLTCVSFISLILTLTIYSNLTYERNFDWKNDITLWSHEVSLQPYNFLAQNNLALAYIKLGQTAYALKIFQEGIRAHPDYDVLHLNLALLYGQIGDYDKAIDENKKTISLNPANDKAYNNLGYIYSKKNNNYLALEEFKKAVQLKPSVAIYHFNLARVYETLGDHKSSIKEINQAKITALESYSDISRQLNINSN